MTSKQIDLTKNFFALGHHVLAVRAEHGPDAPLDRREVRRPGPVVAEANKRALKAGYAFGETTEIFHTHYRVAPAKLPPGHVPEHHRQRGDRARLPGRVASWPTGRCSTARTRSPRPATSSTSSRATRPSGSRPSRPRTRSPRSAPPSGRATAARSALTASSGPGIALKTEAMGLAVMVELPLVVIDVQRAGPSTGMPTKNEQADLLQVMFGRNSRLADADRRAGHARRVLRPGDRGLPARAQVHDPGRLPLGRVPGHRLGAVAVPSLADLPEIARRERDRRRDLPAVPARPRDARPSVGGPGHARPRAPHRRPREGRHHRQRELRPGQPPPDADAPRGQGGRASPTTSRRSRSSGRSVATC